MDFRKQLLIVLSTMLFLEAQYQGIYTSVDHLPGNLSATPTLSAEFPTNVSLKNNISPGTTTTLDQRISRHSESSAPLSRSYYLWAEATSSTLFSGGLSTVLLAAATINGYEDIASITITGPKPSVSATRWDLPMNLQIAYTLSSGVTPLGETPTTATSYARSGSSATFTSTEATPQLALSYKTSADGAPEGNWSNAFSLSNSSETTATLVPSVLESTVNQSYFSSSTFSNFHLALMQSSIREVAAYSTFRIFPFPTISPSFSSSLGTPLRNEQIAHTTFLSYSIQSDPAALPALIFSGSNGFPQTRWEIVHQKPDGSSKTLLSTSIGTSPSNPLSLDATNLKLYELIQTSGTHTFRLYNRFDEIAVPETKELIYEITLSVQFLVKVKAHVHTYE